MDDEELEQGGQGNANGVGGRFNPANKVANGAQNVQDVANAASKVAEKSSEKLAQKAVQQTGKKSAKTAAKAAKRKKMSQTAANIATKAGRVAQIATKISKIMSMIGFIIIILIAIIGLLVFIITGFGFIIGGLQQIVGGFLDFFDGIGDGKERTIQEETIRDTLSYLEEMNYDLFGYGFIEDEKGALQTQEEKDDDGNVTSTTKSLGLDADDEAYRYITSYIISDNYAFTLKNTNRNFKTAFSSFSNFFSGLLGDTTAWGSGLISIYHQASDPRDLKKITGIKGKEYGRLESGSITIENGNLRIKGPGWFGSGDTLEYSLDGWTGRYSMPLEFLLATHIATMAPDLSYKMATSFNTDVQILLYGSDGGNINAAVQEKGNESTRTDRSQLAGANNSWFTDKWNFADAISLNSEEILEILHNTALKSYTGENGGYVCQNAPICSENQEITSACDHCTSYVKLIYRAMNEIKVSDLETFVPYINKVTDHWFRNVYFTKGAIKQDDATIISSDDEYEKKTGERWTEYETYTDDNGQQQYELYIYKKKSNGEYNTKLEDIVCRNVGAGKGEYKLSDNEVTYIKQNGGAYSLFTKKNHGEVTKYTEAEIEEFRVGKKAITKAEDDLFAGNDSAYEAGDSDGNWETVEVNENSPSTIKEASELGLEFLYTMRYPTVEQIEDGERGETNPIIKKLFLDEYYIYDGTPSRAALIKKAKEMVRENSAYGLTLVDGKIMNVDDPDTFKKIFGDSKEIKTTYDGQQYTATIDQISNPISLTHNSLTAFSILENMHTLDAEYIYHDFKELIVELNYFDKEDLTEAQDEVMMFPVAGVSAAGWPATRYDKREEFYGTLIHSATDLEARRAETEAELAVEYGLDAEVDTIDEDTNTPNTESKGSSDGLFSSEQCQDGSCNRIVKANGIEYKQFAQGDYTALNNDGHSIKEGGCGICSTAALLTGYGYDVDPNSIVTKKAQLGLKWYPDSGQRAQNIQKIFQSYGIEGEWKTPSSLEEIKKVLHEALDNGIPVIIREAAGGSIWRTGGGHYFGVVGQDSDGKLYTVDSATKSDIARLVNDGGIDALANDINGHLLMIFVPNQAPDGTQKTSYGSAAEPEFAGFTGSTEDSPEYVVAPVTGEVIKYGTVNRKNIETGEDNEVGFIKIRVLGSKECKPNHKKGCTRFGGNHTTVSSGDGKKYSDGKLTATEWLSDKYDENQLRKLGYDYFWSEYNSAGIGDHIVYLEGFDVSEILGSGMHRNAGKAGGNIEKLASYVANEETPNSYQTQYIVPNLLDDKRELELQIEEEAKKQAAYTMKEGNKIYIKEGAIIGKTYSSDDENITKETKLEILKKNQDEEKDELETKNKKYKIGNYLKIIFRDTDDEVVENVEEFVERGSQGTSINGDLSAQIEAVMSALGIQAVDSSNGNIKEANKYWDLIVKYSNEFGLDPYLVRAMICQESGANPQSDNGSAYGLMQWEYAANGTEIEVEDANGQKVKITGITKEALAASVDLQIRAGCAELKTKLLAFENNVCAMLVGYNFGTYGCYGVLNYHAGGHSGTIPHHDSSLSNQGREYLKSGDMSWVTDDDRQKYRDTYSAGDPLYIEHVLQYYITE